MGDTAHHQHPYQQQPTTSRLGLRNSGGEIVEVQGGHIVRSTGRKDRHSKVCTAKGPRDRRVRLSANTAIQFYDVQDRLGYDRPSKAVDWLIKNAKPAIDELAELPAWKPTTGSTANLNFDEGQTQDHENHRLQHQQQHQIQIDQQQHQIQIDHHDVPETAAGPSNKRAMTRNRDPTDNQSFLPPSLDSDSIADTIKSFFPMGAATEPNSSGIQFHGFPPPDLLSRTSSQSQDLRLSLQSFQAPILLHHHNQQTQHQDPTSHSEQALFSRNTPLSFDNAGWSDSQAAEIGRFQRMAAWNAGGDTTGAGGGGGGGFAFNLPSTPPSLQPLFGQNHLFSQRGPLQSSNTPSVRAWMDPSAMAMAAAADHHRQHYQTLPIHPNSMPGIGFASGGGFSGFQIPARIQGDEEEHDGISDKPSSASSDSRH